MFENSSLESGSTTKHKKNNLDLYQLIQSNFIEYRSSITKKSSKMYPCFQYSSDFTQKLFAENFLTERNLKEFLEVLRDSLGLGLTSVLEDKQFVQDFSSNSARSLLFVGHLLEVINNTEFSISTNDELSALLREVSLRNLVTDYFKTDFYLGLTKLKESGTLDFFLDKAEHSKWLVEQIDSGVCTKQHLSYLLSLVCNVKPLRHLEVESVCCNDYLMQKLLENAVLNNDTFTSFVDCIKKTKHLHEFLEETEIFDQLTSALSKKSIRYLIDKVHTPDELLAFLKNNTLLNYSCKNLLLSKSKIRDFNEQIRKIGVFQTPYTFFSLIDEYQKNDDELKTSSHVLKILNELGLKRSEKLEVQTICIESQKAFSILSQIVENNLVSQYNFNQLKDLLTKDDKKKKQKLNF